MIDIVTDHLNDGKAVGWHQGRTEWGPRALGSSPILGDARNKEMQKRLNLKSNIAKDFALSLLQWLQKIPNHSSISRRTLSS
jgi:carbamoyltransferase